MTKSSFQWSPNRWTIALMVSAPLALSAYFWGSQYYYPSNYKSADARVTNIEEIRKFTRSTSFYNLEFTTITGQPVTYRFEASPYVYTTGQQIPVYYNENNFSQVRIKPERGELTQQMIILLSLPIGIWLIPILIKLKFSKEPKN